jgi:succinylarginine dihydrolase
MPAQEVNFDALVGPTHHYAGLAFGNLASQRFKHTVSSPRRAALEGLAKMKRLADLGIAQAVLPPHDRPDIATLRRLGFHGSPAQTLASAAATNPSVLAACSSASAMWAANAATVSPGADTADCRLHCTVANLVSQFHRSLEPPTTAAVFRKLFADESQFAVHEPLPTTSQWADEGAANHTRLCASFDTAGIEIFAYGRDDNESARTPRRFPARQARAASEAIARLHQLDPARVLFLQQSPAAIDAGVFHNDVICVGNQNVLLYHEAAFAPGDPERITETFLRTTGESLHVLRVSEAELPVATAVETYLFNSQLITLPNQSMILIAPAECETNPAARAVIDQLIAGHSPIDSAIYVDVRQSMQNGGGPACLRLRVVLTEVQRAAIAGRVFLHDDLYSELKSWIMRHYRDELHSADLADPSLFRESREALDQLTGILQLEGVYGFQREVGC